MKILAANLKHLYQCRAMWLSYFFIFFFVPFGFLIPSRGPFRDSFLGYGLISLFVGFVIGGLQRDVLTKPFSFCLPGHRNMPGRMVFFAGSITSLLLALLFLKRHMPESQSSLLTTLAAGFAGMICCFLGARVIFRQRTKGYYFILILLAIFFYGIHGYGIRMVLEFPVPVIASGMLICGIVWKHMGQDSLARENCGKTHIGPADSFNMKKMRKYRQEYAAQRPSEREPATLDGLEDFFLVRMKACRPFSGNRYILGNLYVRLGGNLGARQLFHWCLTLVFLALFCGYVFPRKNNSFLFILPAFAAVFLDLIPHRKLLLPGGRTEKYFSALTLGLFVTVLSTLALATFAALSHPLSIILPDITIGGDTLAFTPFDARMAYLCFVLMPIAMMLGTLFSERHFLKMIFMGVAIGIGVSLSASAEGLLSQIGIPGAIVLVAIAWISCAALLRYYCQKRPLVGQGM